MKELNNLHYLNFKMGSTSVSQNKTTELK